MALSSKHAVVVGGGIVGSAQALMLASIGFRVTLVDAGPRTSHQHDYHPDCELSLRTVAMSYRSRQLLESFGLWPEDLGCPIHTVKVSDKGRFGTVRFDRRDYSLPALGYVMSNAHLEYHLASLIRANGTIDVRKPARAELVSVDAKHTRVTVTDDSKADELVADLLVAADGTRSSVRSQLGIEVTTTDYSQHALVANVGCQHRHNNIAYERFTDSGPLAILPHGRHVVSVVCAIDSDDVEEIKSLTTNGLLQELQQRFGGRLGRFQQIGEYALFPLSLVQAHRQVVGCGVIVGNASLTLHPVAGQGLNLALRDLVELTANLSRQPSVEHALLAFEKNRIKDKRYVARQTHLLARWFRRQPGPLSIPASALKTPSMLMLDTVPWMRDLFGRRNAGLDISLSHTGQGVDEFDPCRLIS